MLQPKPIALIAALLLAAQAQFAGADHGSWSYDVVPGSARVDSGRIEAYTARWAQLRPGEKGLEATGGTFEEVLTRSGAAWQHVQIMRTNSGPVITERRRLDIETLQPLSLRREMEGGPEGAPVAIDLSRAGRSWTGTAWLADESERPFAYEQDLPAFDGWIAGIVIAALPLAEGFRASLPAAIPLQKSTYRLGLHVVGQERFEMDSGRSVPVWVVESEWINISDGSVSAGGREQAGGVYLIAVEPGAGVPYVIEYANESGVIRWTP